MTRYSSSSLAIHPLICTLTLYRYSPLDWEGFFYSPKKYTTLQKLNKSNKDLKMQKNKNKKKTWLLRLITFLSQIFLPDMNLFDCDISFWLVWGSDLKSCIACVSIDRIVPWLRMDYLSIGLTSIDSNQFPTIEVSFVLLEDKIYWYKEFFNLSIHRDLNLITSSIGNSDRIPHETDKEPRGYIVPWIAYVDSRRSRVSNFFDLDRKINMRSKSTIIKISSWVCRDDSELDLSASFWSDLDIVVSRILRWVIFSCSIVSTSIDWLIASLRENFRKILNARPYFLISDINCRDFFISDIESLEGFIS